ncbi:four-helix bundle copper-binding protein [Sphingomonas sp.]|uniref:four-helix bundle copper-binding protein n=1 Tax=Sphingomonas sp. TaxID=28214 RepID=UPI003B3A6B9B
MSIRKMIAAHPDVGGHVNEPLAEAAKHAMYCGLIATSCADACSAEDMDMTQCIRVCLDCADVCAATARLAVRRAGSNESALRAMLQACITICDICADECEKHDHEHCRRCAEMCRECARDCREALATIAY